MAQANRDEFAFAEDRILPLDRERAQLSLASGDEAPVLSPALELQRALDEMLMAAPKATIDYRRGLALTVGLMAATAVCAAFWWSAVTWTSSLLG